MRGTPPLRVSPARRIGIADAVADNVPHMLVLWYLVLLFPSYADVADFSAGVVYNIDAQGNCQSVCSLTGDTLCNSQINGNALCGYDYENRAQYVDTVTLYNGQAYHYAYIDPLGPIPMAEHEIYISTKTGLPLRFLADFMPFGKVRSPNLTLHGASPP